MSRLSIIPTITVLIFLSTTSCTRNKPKPEPVSKDITRTSIVVNGKKDSVINNPQKNYGNATIAEPCVKCLIQVIQVNKGYKEATKTANATKLKYVVNWVRASQPVDTSNTNTITNGLKIDVLNTDMPGEKLASFIYDNKLTKLYYSVNNKKIDTKTDVSSLKNIRNKCYWGVASSK